MSLLQHWNLLVWSSYKMSNQIGMPSLVKMITWRCHGVFENKVTSPSAYSVVRAYLSFLVQGQQLAFCHLHKGIFNPLVCGNLQDGMQALNDQRGWRNWGHMTFSLRWWKPKQIRLVCVPIPVQDQCIRRTLQWITSLAKLPAESVRRT